MIGSLANVITLPLVRTGLLRNTCAQHHHRIRETRRTESMEVQVQVRYGEWQSIRNVGHEGTDTYMLEITT